MKLKFLLKHKILNKILKCSAVIVLSIFVLILSISLLLLTQMYYSNFYLKDTKFVLKYDKNLSLEDIQHIKNIINEIDPLYLEGQQFIYVTQNIEQKLFENYLIKNDSYVGFNIGPSGKIYIQYKEDDEYLRDVICHELLHTYLKLDDKITHKIVDELSELEVCFKNKIKNEIKHEVEYE